MTAREATSFEQTELHDAVVLAVSGDLDVVSAPAFREALHQAVDTGRRLVAVDLAAVPFLDSAALSVVFGARRELPVERRLVLANVPDRMSRVLRLAGVASVVEVHTPGQPEPWLESS